MSNVEKLNVIVSGSDGHMGTILSGLISGREDMVLVPEPDMYNAAEETYSGVVVDFSNAAKTEALLGFCRRNKLPLVIATTGHSEDEKAMIEEASKDIPIFFSYNMSIGIALLSKLVKEAVSTFPGASVEIVETHHVRKMDAPSGTAIMLAEAAISARPELHMNAGRSGLSPRENDEIGVQSIRIGDVVGIHEVMISTGAETVTLKHEAHDRKLFGEGALQAARFIADKGAGLYTMKDLINEEK